MKKMLLAVLVAVLVSPLVNSPGLLLIGKCQPGQIPVTNGRGKTCIEQRFIAGKCAPGKKLILVDEEDLIWKCK